MHIMVLNSAAVMRMRQHQMAEATVLLRTAIASLPQLYAYEILTGTLVSQPSTSTSTSQSPATATTQPMAPTADNSIGTQEEHQQEEDQIGFVTGMGILNQDYRRTDSYLLPADDNVLVLYDRAFTFQQNNNDHCFFLLS